MHERGSAYEQMEEPLSSGLQKYGPGTARGHGSILFLKAFSYFLFVCLYLPQELVTD